MMTFLMIILAFLLFITFLASVPSFKTKNIKVNIDKDIYPDNFKVENPIMFKL